MARHPNRCSSSTGPSLNEPLFSCGLEKGSSYHGAMIGWRVDLEKSERGSSDGLNVSSATIIWRAFAELFGYGRRSVSAEARTFAYVVNRGSK